MRTIHFNFNNEVDSFPITEEDDGRVTIHGEDGAVMAEYEGIEQFAQFYAQARDVRPDHLKNWVLVEQGDVVSYVLRAGTAGVSSEQIEELIDEAFADIQAAGTVHPLDLNRVRMELVDVPDVMRALAQSLVPDAAKVVYDALAAKDAFVAPELTAELEEEPDTRSEMERYLDQVLETDQSLVFFARLVNQPDTAGKEEILAAFAASLIPYTVEMASNLYEGALTEAMKNAGVNGRFEALLVLTQTVPGEPDGEIVSKYMVSARMAGRTAINLPVYRVGRRYIKQSAKLVPFEELVQETIYDRNGTPVVISFDDAVDDEVETELEAARAEMEAAQAEMGEGLAAASSVSGAAVRALFERGQALSEQGDDDEDADAVTNDDEWF